MNEKKIGKSFSIFSIQDQRIQRIHKSPHTVKSLTYFRKITEGKQWWQSNI